MMKFISNQPTLFLCQFFDVIPIAKVGAHQLLHIRVCELALWHLPVSLQRRVVLADKHFVMCNASPNYVDLTIHRAHVSHYLFPFLVYGQMITGAQDYARLLSVPRVCA